MTAPRNTREPEALGALLAKPSPTRTADCLNGPAHPNAGVQFTQTMIGARGWVPDRCPDCVKTEEAALRARELEERTEREQKARLDKLAVPLLYAASTLSNFELRPPEGMTKKDGELTRFVEPGPEALARGRVYKLATAYLADWSGRQEPAAFFPHVVIFRGGTGTGKGHVMWSIAKEVVTAQHSSALVAKLSDIVRDIREAWRRGNDGPSEGQRLARYRYTDLLIIDEVSRHALFGGEYTQHLYDLVDWRQERLMPTILTTNEDDAGLADLLGPALVSRARAWSGIWDFGSVDFRATVLAERRKAARKGRAG